MGLFAASVLAGALIAVVSPDPKRIKDWLAERLGVFIGFIICLLIIYSVLWLQYADIAAPSKAFRLTHFSIRALTVLPLLIAAGAVGFESVRWLLRIRWGEDKHIVAHGIGIGAAGLLVLGLFLFQDERMSGLITSVRTPILSVDLNKLSDSDKPISPLSGNFGGGNGKISSEGDEDDPVLQSIEIVKSLADAIQRDLEYAETLGTDVISKSKRQALNNDREIFKATLVGFAECVVALRRRVPDRQPLIFMDREAATFLRTTHRQLLNGDRSGFENRISEFIWKYATRFFSRLETLRSQLELITPPEERQIAFSACYDLPNSALSPQFWERLFIGGMTNDGRYFSLLTAAAFNMISEKLAAVAEIDLWIDHQKKAEQNTKPKKNSADYRLFRITRMRAEFWAGRILLADPEFATTAIRRYRQAVEEIRENISSGFNP